MEDLELLKQFSHSSPMLIAASILFFARQLRTSITHLENSIEKMQDSLRELNVTLTKIIIEHTVNGKAIDDLKLKFVNLKCSNCKP